MAQFEEQYLGNHRRQQALILVMSMLCLLLAVAPRQQRALFITQGNGLQAFGVAVPPINLATLTRLPDRPGGNDVPSAFFARTPGRPEGATPFGNTPAAPATSGPSESPVGDGAPATPLADTASVVPATTPGSGGGLPFIPVSFSPPSASPVAPGTTNAVAPTPVATATPTPVATSTPTPVAAVPEPATWLLMMLGFFGVGLVVRKRVSFVGRRYRAAGRL